MVGFAQVPAELLDARISDRAKVLWSVLDVHQRDNGDSWPSRDHLAEHLGCSIDSVDRAAAELRDASLIEIKVGRGRGNTNRYRLLDRPEKGRSRAAISAEKAAPVRSEKAAPVRPRNIDRETDSAVQNQLGAARADAVLAVLPNRLAGGITRSTLEQACAELPNAWTPEALGRAADGARWPNDARKGGMVVGWVRDQASRQPPRQSRPVAKKRCPNGRPYAVDGSCDCGEDHTQGDAA